MDAADIDHNFEPQFRARSNTWPLRPNRELEPQNGSPASEDPSVTDGQIKQEKGDPLGLTAKKSGARRNAWGNLSYADLITKAIQSTPEKRLTLSQIYDWMVQNVPFFKDKGDSTSSAGWKNSIRHNLSLHSRFMRIQNEGTGKSSWWVINPDARPGKQPRRRAGSMEAKNYEKKRGRINKKKLEAMRAAAAENGGSPYGSIDYVDVLGFAEGRPRTGSNASSCGRLSPIQAGVESDLHDNQVPPMSPIPSGPEVDDFSGMYQDGENFSDLMKSLVMGMKLSPPDSMDVASNLNSDPYLTNGGNQEYNNSPQNFLGVTEGFNEPNQFSHLPAPPPYPERSPPAPTSQQSSPMSALDQQTFSNGSYPNLSRSLKSSYFQPNEMYSETVMEPVNTTSQLSVNTQQPQHNSPDRSQQNSPNPQAFTSHLSPQACRANTQQELSPLNHQQQQAMLGSPVQRTNSSVQAQQQQQQQQTSVTNASILRGVLTRGPALNPLYNQPTTTTAQFNGLGMTTAPTTCSSSSINTNMLNHELSPHRHNNPLNQQQQLRNLTSTSNNFMGDTVSTGRTIVNNGNMYANFQARSNNNMLLDIDMESLMPMEFDMEQVISQELSLEGNLDFSFDIGPSTTIASQNIVH